MTKTRSEIREGFLTWLRENRPEDVERLINATEFGVEVLLLSKHELRKGESLYDVTDSERVEHWCDLMRTEDSWARLDESRNLSAALSAYLRYVEWLDLEQEREVRRTLGAVSHEEGLGGHASQRDSSDGVGGHASQRDSGDESDSSDAQGSASSKDTQGSASSQDAQGSASSKDAQGSASSQDAQGSASSKDAQGSASSQDAQGSASSKDAQGSASSKDAQGSASSKDTQGSASSKDAQGSASSQYIELSDEELIEEGEAKEVVMTKYERNPRARQKCIEAYGSTYRCEVCGFNFEKVYGPRDAGQYIEVHHIAEHALRSRAQGRHVIDCKNDLIPLCANCHRMIHHLRAQTLSPDELRSIMEEMSGRHASKRDSSDRVGGSSSQDTLGSVSSKDAQGGASSIAGLGSVSSKDAQGSVSSHSSQSTSMGTTTPYMDVNGEFRYWERHLPHFSQNGVIQFITFRLGDSLPQSQLEELRAEKDAFANLHPQPWDEATMNLYYKTSNKKIEYWLEQGYGDCVLRRPEARQILTDALKQADGVKYQLLGYVIMPNHVHVLMLPLSGYDCVKAIGSVKQYSARQINKLLDRTGKLWNDETFDRMIRNEEHLDNCLRYIKENPSHIPYGEFTLYFNYDLINAIPRR